MLDVRPKNARKRDASLTLMPHLVTKPLLDLHGKESRETLQHSLNPWVKSARMKAVNAADLIGLEFAI